ncbi:MULTISPECIES: hypothetical protein [Actinomycetes]|uniref:Uncharacterized protein n=1 Tax=Nocardia testacea TaxID=248551 RepID=A0ABW7WAB2_9NOCA
MYIVPTNAQLTVAREYLTAYYDQTTPDYYAEPEEISEFCAELSPQQVVSRINTIYDDGGWPAFCHYHEDEIAAVEIGSTNDPALDISSPSKAEVAQAWALTVAGTFDRVGVPHGAPEWWAAWLDSKLRFWRGGCRPMAPFSREARRNRPVQVPEMELDKALQALPAAHDNARAAWRRMAGTWVMNDTTAYQALDHLICEVERHADWPRRRSLPLREQVRMLLLLDAVRGLRCSALTPTTMKGNTDV